MTVTEGGVKENTESQLLAIKWLSVHSHTVLSGHVKLYSSVNLGRGGGGTVRARMTQEVLRRSC